MTFLEFNEKFSTEQAEIEDSKSFHYHCLINDIPFDIILIMRKAVDDIDKLRYYKLIKIKEKVINEK